MFSQKINKIVMLIYGIISAYVLMPTTNRVVVKWLMPIFSVCLVWPGNRHFGGLIQISFVSFIPGLSQPFL
ncbi:MAG TPA: hypothetical protein DCZ13_00220 [Porticoccaceae bacterium]|nr:hypothetical protein [Porticoccaceae bacterium]